MSVYEDALAFHEEHAGKIEVVSKVPLNNKEVLSLAYTPGVAEVSRVIAADPSKARTYTMKRNTVAIVTDGSAVLGLGNIGPLAALPVMEGKAAIFKEFAGVDAVPICLDTQDTEEIIKAVKQIAPAFGGINLEDIAAPKCFEIERRLRGELDIPVMHDDQWGAATVTLAGIINSLELAGISKDSAKVVMSGLGAAGVATARLLIEYGVANITFCDSQGIVHSERDDLTAEKIELLAASGATPTAGELADAIVGANIFIGLSKPGVLTQDMVRSMGERPIIFALANPLPEIMPDDAKAAGAFIVSTGRSDFPNQANNSLVFPGAFRGALDANLKQFELSVFGKIAEAIAGLVYQPSVDMILPDMLDPRAPIAVADVIATESTSHI